MAVFHGVLRAAQAKIAFVAFGTAKWAYEKEGVQYVLPQPFSSGLVVLVAGAVGTNMRLTEGGHGPLLSF